MSPSFPPMLSGYAFSIGPAFVFGFACFFSSASMALGQNQSGIWRLCSEHFLLYLQDHGRKGTVGGAIAIAGLTVLERFLGRTVEQNRYVLPLKIMVVSVGPFDNQDVLCPEVYRFVPEFRFLPSHPLQIDARRPVLE